MAYAKETSPLIRLDLLKECLSSGYYQKLVKNNTDYAMKIMDEDLDTPTFFLNGKKIEGDSYQKIKEAIDAISNQ